MGLLVDFAVSHPEPEMFPCWTQTDETAYVKSQQRPAPSRARGEEPPYTEARGLVMACIRLHPDLTSREIAMATGLDAEVVYAATRALYEQGVIARSGGSIRNQWDPARWAVTR